VISFIFAFLKSAKLCDKTANRLKYTIYFSKQQNPTAT